MEGVSGGAVLPDAIAEGFGGRPPQGGLRQQSAQKAAQREIGRQGSLTAEGRDMGTAVFPGADVKFFLDARPEVRARRRAAQLAAMGRPAEYAEILDQIRKRDDQDRNRAAAPLVPADDAVIIDTSDLTVDEVFAAMLARVPS